MGIASSSLLATLAKLEPDDIFGALFMISPVATAVWGWVSWARAKPRFALPKWRSGLALAGLVSVSLALLTYVPYLHAMSAMSLDEFKDKMNPTIVNVIGARIDFLLNLFAIGSALIGKGRIRVPVLASALLLQVILFIRKVHLVMEEPGKDAPKLRGNVHNTDTRFWVKTEGEKPITEEHFRSIEAACGRNLDFISAVYRIAGVHGLAGLVSPLANVLLIKVPGREGKESEGLEAVFARHGLKEMTEKSKYLGGYHYFVIADPKKNNAYELRERLLSSDLRGAEMEFEVFAAANPLASVPNDPLFFMQWDMTQIDAPTGWNLATGAGHRHP
jgi:hypothetical protein